MNTTSHELGAELDFKKMLEGFNINYRIKKGFNPDTGKDIFIYNVISVSDENGVNIDVEDINFFSLFSFGFAFTKA